MTINYTEKGDGQHEAIRKAGHWLREENGAWVSSDDEAVQTIIDAYVAPDPLVVAKASKSREVSLHATNLFDKAVAGISRGELAGWPILRAEAIAFQQDSSADCPALQDEAVIRGISVASLAQKVIGNAAYFDPTRAAIAGISGKHRDAISALATLEQVAAYDFSTGWPAV